MSVYDVVIIGGGIVGAACADECAREGLRVAIVEAKMIGGGATAAGMGHLLVLDAEPRRGMIGGSPVGDERLA